MTPGLGHFKEHFQDYSDHYVLIGGVAAMQWLEEANLHPRATKDFDLVLLIEKLDAVFLNRFWDFVKAGAYDNRQKSTGQRLYYRFTTPQNTDYPTMLEIFSRTPDQLELWDEQTIIPIPADDDASSLSAILMDEDYYGIVKENKQVHDGLSLLSPQGLILLKAKAFLDLSNRKTIGKNVDEKHIKKHRNDVFKLALLLTLDLPLTIPRPVHADLQEFLQNFPPNSPEWNSIGQAAGLGNAMPKPYVVLDALSKAFQVS